MYIEANATKFDSYLKKNTEFDDISIYVEQLKSKQVDWVLDLTLLLSTYNRNMKVLYYCGEILKEKVINMNTKNGNDGSSAGLSTLENEEYLMFFLTKDRFIPLLVDENDSDISSEKSTELVTNSNVEINPKKDAVLANYNNKDEIYTNMSKFANEEFETKLNIGENRNNSVFEDPDLDDDAPLFEEIWKRPGETIEDQDLNLDSTNNVHSGSNVSMTNAPPGFENKINGSGSPQKTTKRK